MEMFYEHHVLHSLSIAKWITFKPETTIMDLGSGGGFPGIPLAVYFESADFTLVDSIRKKVGVVDQIIQELELNNVRTMWSRAEDVPDQFDFIVVRAVAHVDKIIAWCRNKIHGRHRHAVPNGIIMLKGGQIEEELRSANIRNAEIVPLSYYFSQDYFKEKYLIYIPAY